MRTVGYVVAALLALALSFYPLSIVGDLYPYLFLAIAAAVAFGLSLVTREWVLVGPGAGILLLSYGLALRQTAVTFDFLVVVLAIGLLVLLDVLDLVPLLVRRPKAERGVLVAHAAQSVIAAALGAALAIVVVVAARFVGGGPALLAAPAALAALGAVILAVVLARRSVEG